MFLDHWLKFAIDFGLKVKTIIGDGNIHRVSTVNKPGKKSGWYVAYTDSQILTVGDWSTADKASFKPNNKGGPAKDKAELQQAIKAAEKAKRHHQRLTAIDARLRFDTGDAVIGHSYLTKKQISCSDGIKIEGNQLLIPMYDIVPTIPVIKNLQTISPLGKKYFLPCGQVTGLCHLIGFIAMWMPKKLYIVEGFATGMSIYEASGVYVLVAFNAGNLIHIAKRARTRWPDTEIIIAGDDDWLTEQKTGKNTGKVKALEAALAINAEVTFPPFTDTQKKADLTDWNDYLTRMGGKHHD